MEKQLTERERNAVKHFKNIIYCDYILEVRQGIEFVEIVSSTGGDIHTHRVYDTGKDTGKIYER